MNSLLLITTSYPSQHGDGKEAAGSFVADFAEALAQRVPVTVLAPGTSDGDETSGKLRVRRFAGPSRPMSLLNPLNPTHWLSIAGVLCRGARAAEVLAREQRFSHILALWALPSGYWARRLKRKHGIPYSIWALGSDIWSLGKVPLVRRILRQVLRDSSENFADGYVLGEDVKRMSGRPCRFLASVRKLPGGHAKQTRTAPPYRLAFLGRWHSNKGIDLLLEALARLDNQDWRKIEAFRICGGGPLESLVHAHGKTLTNVGRPVCVEGYLDKSAAAALMAWADYLVVPSRIESIPVIFSDAVQARCPLIVTPVGDLPRLIREHGVGILAKTASADDIAVAICNALLDTPAHYAARLEQAQTQFSVAGSCEEFLRRVSAELS